MSELIDKIAARFRKEAPSALRVELPPHLRLPEDEIEVHVQLSLPDWNAAQKCDTSLLYEALGLSPMGADYIPRDGTKPCKMIFHCSRSEVEKVYGNG